MNGKKRGELREEKEKVFFCTKGLRVDGHKNYHWVNNNYFLY